LTIIARRIIAIPERSAREAWEVIVDILAPQTDSTARKELTAIAGIACSLIADEAMKAAPVVVYGSGPRVRMYCLYNDDAVTGEDAKEDALTFNATADDWHISLPCPAEDLSWVQSSLKKLSSRVTARDMTASDVDGDNENELINKTIAVDKEAYFRP
jgi:hypothetical protein